MGIFLIFKKKKKKVCCEPFRGVSFADSDWLPCVQGYMLKCGNIGSTLEKTIFRKGLQGNLLLTWPPMSG